MVLLAAIEWNWGEAILDESWRDAFTVVGFAVTFLGFIVTIWQLRKTQSAVKAAQAATKKALDESRVAYYRFLVVLAHRYIHEAKAHLEHDAWDKGNWRLNDLREQLKQLVALDDAWTTLLAELDGWTMMCNRLTSNERKTFPKPKWLDFCQRVETQLNRVLTPFPLK